MRKFAAAVMIAALAASWGTAFAQMPLDGMWSKTRPLMDRAVELYAGPDDPEKRDLARIVTFRSSKIQDIVDDTLVILGSSAMSDDIAELDSLAGKIRKLRADIGKDRAKLIGAPESSSNPFADTKERLNRSIEKSLGKIGEYERLSAELKARAKKHAGEAGIGISPETVDYLCVAPNGSSIAQIMAVSKNIRDLIEYVGARIGAAGADDAQVAHTYAGLYFIGCRTQVESYDVALKEIREVYQPRLKKLYADATALVKETKKMIASADAGSAKTLKANLETSQKAIWLMDEYGKYLVRQRKNLESDRAKAEARLKVAVNTLKTVTISSQVIGLVRSSMKDLESVFSFQLPDARLLGDVYGEEFARLMEMLKSR